MYPLLHHRGLTVQRIGGGDRERERERECDRERDRDRDRDRERGRDRDRDRESERHSDLGPAGNPPLSFPFPFPFYCLVVPPWPALAPRWLLGSCEGGHGRATQAGVARDIPMRRGKWLPGHDSRVGSGDWARIAGGTNCSTRFEVMSAAPRGPQALGRRPERAPPPSTTRHSARVDKVWAEATTRDQPRPHASAG
eukprot:gene14470-biopygen11152